MYRGAAGMKMPQQLVAPDHLGFKMAIEYVREYRIATPHRVAA